jgi:phospholipase/lecithinase/hemolysin
MCNCERCTAIRNTKLTEDEVKAMKVNFDKLFPQFEEKLPDAAAAFIHGMTHTANILLPEQGATIQQLFAAATAYFAYWTLVDSGLHPEAVVYLREKLKAATPTLVPKIRAALERQHLIFAMRIDEALLANVTPPVDPRTLN